MNVTTDTDFTVDWGPTLKVDPEIEQLRQQWKVDGPLDHLGPYVRLRKLGSGGCGTVYLANDSTLKRQVAIKVPHPSMFNSDSEHDRFMQEAQIVAVLKHPNIVEIHQAAIDKDFRYLVFEYCAGGSLAEWLVQHPSTLSPKLCARIITSLAHALDHAHQQGIVHRDVNPRNVLLSPLTEFHSENPNEPFPFIPKLSDFGLGTWVDEHRTAVQTQPGSVFGTMAYMAPEQTEASPTAQLPLVDIYSLGVMLYELLTGVRPFVGATPVETLRMIREVNPVHPRRHNPAIPRDLETICLKCMEKSPSLRYPSVKALLADLEAFQLGNPIRARRQSVIEHSTRWIAKRRLQCAAASILTLGFALFLVRMFGLAHELQTSRGNEAGLKQQSDARATQLAQAARDRSSLNAKVQTQSERVRRLSYINEMQLVADIAPTRPFNAIETLRKWIPEPGESDLRGFEWYYLMQACGGDIAMFPRAFDGATSCGCLCLSPDGRRVYVSHDFNATNHAIVGWDIATGRLLDATVKLPNRRLAEFTPSPDGQRLLTIHPIDSTIEVHSLSGLAPPRRISSTNSPFLYCDRIVAHPIRNEVLTICTGQARHPTAPTLIWNDLKTGRQLHTITWERGAVRNLLVDPTADSVIVSVDNSIEVYDRAQRKTQVLKLSDHLPFRSLALSADCQQLAIATDQQQTLLCRKKADGQWELVGNPVSKRPGHLYEGGFSHPMFNSLHFDATGRYLFTLERGAMVLQATSSDEQPREVARFTDLTARHVQPLKTGLVAAWMSDRRCGLWRPSLPMASMKGHSKETWSVAYSHDGKLMASSSDDETAALWDVQTGEQIAVLKGQCATVTAVAFSPDDSQLAMGSLDGSVMVWNVNSRQHMRTLQPKPTEVRALAWFPDGKRLATVDSPRNSPSNSIVVWDVASGNILDTFHGFNNRIQSVLVTSDQQAVIGVSDDKSIKAFRVDDKSNTDIPWRSWSTDEPIRCGVLLDQDRKVATGDIKGMIRIWDAETGIELSSLKGHTDTVLCLQLSPDGKILASGGVDKSINLWDLETGLRVLTFKNLSTQVNGLAFSPAGDILTAALHDGTIKHFYAPRISPIQFSAP